jgi:hypothetical protein
LLWVVVFNYKAESPTYVIAAFGAGFWAVASRRSLASDLALFFFFVLTELAATDLCPPEIRHAWVQPYRLKALPALLLWGLVVCSLMTRRAVRMEVAGPHRPIAGMETGPLEAAHSV